jgi:hypothetical protein
LTAPLTPDDDLLHVPASADRWWTETYWFSFDQPGSDLSATIYPLFRPNLGVCSLGIYLWDPSAYEPWAIPYGRSYWHLQMPVTPATALDIQGLSYRCFEPLQRYRVTYADSEIVDMDLEWRALGEPHVASNGPGGGHFDQACRVEGTVTIRGTRHEIAAFGMRDRTWAPRPENRRNAGTAYTYGIGSAGEQFLTLTALNGNTGSFLSGTFSGYLIREGSKSSLVDAHRRVVERRHGYPARIEIEATDAEGRTLEATGVTLNRLANQANASQFAWMSMTRWTVSGSPAMIGEDQEVWSPDMLGGSLRELTR